MKYIRTKKYIFALSDDRTYGKRPAGNSNTMILLLKNYKNWKKCRQADTIEELCDEIVIDNPKADIKKPFVSNAKIDEIKKNTPKGSLEYKLKKDGMNIYGAIWTDEGLIYQAKLNEKGEFELI